MITAQNIMNSFSMKELELELNKLKAMEENTPEIFKRLDNEFWILKGLKDLYQLCKDVKQVEIPEEHSTLLYVPVKRVIKTKVMIPKSVIQKLNIPHVMFIGLYFAVDGYSVRKDVMKDYFINYLSDECHRIYPSDGELKARGVPDNLKISTMIALDNGYGFAMQDTVINKLFTSYTKYEYLSI